MVSESAQGLFVGVVVLELGILHLHVFHYGRHTKSRDGQDRSMHPAFDRESCSRHVVEPAPENVFKDAAMNGERNERFGAVRTSGSLVVISSTTVQYSSFPVFDVRDPSLEHDRRSTSSCFKRGGDWS